MQVIFEPGVDEQYLDAGQLAKRWNCHLKTAQKRARTLGVAPLLLGGSVLYPISEILRVERGAVASFSRRQTVRPLQLQGKRWPPKRKKQITEGSK